MIADQTTPSQSQPAPANRINGHARAWEMTPEKLARFQRERSSLREEQRRARIEQEHDKMRDGWLPIVTKPPEDLRPGCVEQAEQWLEEQPRCARGLDLHADNKIINTLLREFQIPESQVMRLAQLWNEQCELQRECDTITSEVNHCCEVWKKEKLEEARRLIRTMSRNEFGIVDLAGDRDAPEELVEGILVAGQDTVIGGPLKTLKTTTAISLAIALGTGTPFLGRFCVPVSRQVTMLCAEGGQETILEIASRLCESLKVPLAECGVRFGFKLPNVLDDESLEALRTTLNRNGDDVLIVDPLYRLPGISQVNPASMFGVAELLGALSDVCRSTQTTLAVCHHSPKHTPPGKPMKLDDLAYGGVSEWARSWILLNRRTAYESSSPGRHELYLSYGGSARDTNVLAMDVDESGHGGGRNWSVSLSDVAKNPAARQPNSKAQRATGKAQEYADKIVKAFRQLASDPGATLKRREVADAAKLSGRSMTTGLDLLVSQGRAKVISQQNESGNRKYPTTLVQLVDAPNEHRDSGTSPRRPETGPDDF